MTIYLVVLVSVLSQVGFSGSRVAVSLHALELTANQFVFGSVGAAFGVTTVFISNSVILAASGLLLRKAGIPDSDPQRRQV